MMSFDDCQQACKNGKAISGCQSSSEIFGAVQRAEPKTKSTTMKFRKATHGQLRHKNRQLLLRAIYTGLASSRAELAQETGLAKPTVGDVIGALITEGFL